MSNPDPGQDALASAVVLLNETFAGATGHDLAAETLTPEQQRAIKQASDRARRRR